MPEDENSFYKKYRPTSLDDVVGSETTITALRRWFESDTLPNALLISGRTGSGKTTLCRIIRDHLNCSKFDFKEINSSNERGIDLIRRLQGSMKSSPIKGKRKLVLLDEAHRLTAVAQDASLKMLEDTPKHVYFILATDQPDMLKSTLKGRCTPLPLSSLSLEQLETVIRRVIKAEGIKITPEVSESICEAAEGSARLALVLLDKIRILPAKDQKAAVEEERSKQTQSIDLCRALIDRKPWKEVVRIIESLNGEPEDIRRHVLGYARSCLLKPQPHIRAATIINCFGSNFYDSGAAGLVYACYDAILSNE